MTSCNDLNQEIKDLEARLEAIASTRRGLQAANELADGQPAAKPKVLRTYTGDEVTVDPAQWVTQVEMDAMRMGDETVKQMVQAGFDGRLGPRGATGRMINYAQIDPSEANVAQLLEVMGLKRSESAKGLELRRPFTQQAAANALLQLAQKTGADPRKAAELLKRRIAGIDNLPSAVYSIAKARWDSAVQYADALEELADGIDNKTLTEAEKIRAGNAARWAHFYEQMDAQVRRRVGQALATLRFNADSEISFIDLEKDITKLSVDDVNGNSQVADMLKLTAEGNASELRRRAAAKRLQNMLGGEVNRKGFMAELEILNTLRRANLLSSVSTWVVRNPVSGALIQGMYMAEDTVAGVVRGINKNGLKAGMEDGLGAAAQAARAWQSSWGMAWGNARLSLIEGKGTMSTDNLKYITQGTYESPKDFVNTTLTSKWDEFTNSFYNPLDVGTNALRLMNLMSAGAWSVFGRAGEALFDGSDVGYLAPFRLLNAGDEVNRTMGFVWKANHEAFMRAAEEGRKAGKDGVWIQKRADELAEKTIFSGVFTDDDLIEFRRTRNEKFGIPAGDEIPDDELRATLYNMYKGAPNLADDIGQIANNRSSDIAFNNKLRDPVTQGIQMARQNPVVGWMLPFWKVPVNGLMWVLSRDVMVAMPRQLIMEARQATSRMGGEAAAYTVEEMAEARGRTIVAMAVAAGTHMLWESGIFTDGGPAEPQQAERWRRNNQPYSFSLANTVLAGVKVRANGIDPIDLMGLHADVLRAWHEGYIQQNDAAEAVKLIVFAWGNLLKNKSALKGITAVLNVAQDPERYDFADVLGQQMGGTLPMSGLLGHFGRVTQDIDESQVRQRFPSTEEMAALGKDPIFGKLQPVMNLLQKAFTSAYSSYPGIGNFAPRQKDWLGSTIQRPLGLPLDQTIPFMPVVKPQDPLYDWLERHGFGGKPNPEGKITVTRGAPEVTLTMEEEDYYREQMRTVTGDIPPEAIGASNGRLFSILPFIQGQTLQGALRKLMKDPNYNQLLNNPVGGVSPSLQAQPGQPLSKRKDGTGADLYQPIDDIIDYYDKRAQLDLMRNSNFSFLERIRGLAVKQQENLKAYFESSSALGVVRQ